jgi:hypothetical protein
MSWMVTNERRCTMYARTDKLDERLSEGPQTALEKRYIKEYLQDKGYQLQDLARLPEEKSKQLMREACAYASLKLAEVESRARFKQKIRGSAQNW